jgi:hypothetical protein
MLEPDAVVFGEKLHPEVIPTTKQGYVIDEAAGAFRVVLTYHNDLALQKLGKVFPRAGRLLIDQHPHDTL